MNFKVVPIPVAIAQEVRETGVAPNFGHPAQTTVASAGGYGPCRLCLRRTREGERRTLFNYDPYPEAEEVSVVGPVFIHEKDCKPFSGTGFPDELRGLPIAFRGHLRNGAGIINHRPRGESPEKAIESLFQNPEVAFISMQNEEAACFIARVERGEEDV